MSDAGSGKTKAEPKAQAAAAGKKGGGKKKEAGAGAGTQVAIGEAAHDPSYVHRFKARYNDVIRPELMKKCGYKNPLQVPKIRKIVINIGAGEAASDGKKIQAAVND